MSPEKKLEILRSVESSPLPKREALAHLDVPRSTFYRWRENFRQFGVTGLRDRSCYHVKAWNGLLPEERKTIVEVADQEGTHASRNGS